MRNICLRKIRLQIWKDRLIHAERFFGRGHEMNEQCVHERPLNKLVQDMVAFYRD